jgi:hypothetical protein
MRRSNKSSAAKSLPLAVLILALLVSTNALAQQPESETGSWHFGASIYGWFPDITGKTVFTQPGGGNEFEIDIEDILDNLEFTLMGMFDVRKGRWGFVTDIIYMDVGSSESGTREASIGRRQIPVGAAARADTECSCGGAVPRCRAGGGLGCHRQRRADRGTRSHGHGKVGPYQLGCDHRR